MENSLRKSIGLIVLYICAMIMLFIYGLNTNNRLIMFIIPMVMTYTLIRFYKNYKEVMKDNE
ncbi:hypothetical protein EZV73_00830 [Acidaminobacter sp. JC074]|uniref:hypothetical protein n=1 Tax=Acidaminobacter sp. JC074 TaxID=2530199 RepID=UPI001F116032|nr:hypothetical protein [Acidaminobacter sp. JC074]MCH4886085.1 hypothetical protein [Acidaminobacter sp. JC074]